MNEELLLEILKQYRKQYNHVNEISRITRELETALQRNDTVSAQLLLGMRGEEMAEADNCRKNIRILSENVQEEDRERMERLLCAEPEVIRREVGLTRQESSFLNQISDMHQKIKGILKAVMEVDKVLSKKLAGEKSYYVS
nr:hypothetical protein [uncultured Eisenbergiella sp.]